MRGLYLEGKAALRHQYSCNDTNRFMVFCAACESAIKRITAVEPCIERLVATGV